MRLAELRARPHTSISRVKEYLSCPRRYFLKHELKVTPDFRPAALALGTAWHAFVDEWLMSDDSHAELRERFRDHLKAELASDHLPVLFDDVDEDEGKFVDRAMKMAAVFLGHMKKPDEVVGVELAFSSEIVHPQSGEVLDFLVAGAIDAIVIEGGRRYLWEVKSAARRWSDDQIEFDLQVTLYGRVARERGIDDARLRLIVTTKAALPSLQIVDVQRGLAEEEELAALFFSVHRGIRAGVDHPIRGWQCRGCPYAGSCR